MAKTGSHRSASKPKSAPQARSQRTARKPPDKRSSSAVGQATARTLKNPPSRLPDAIAEDHSVHMPASEAVALRAFFWSNILRDMLTNLSTVQEKQPELFDGRIAVLTHNGERIAIAHIAPIFGMSVPGAQRDVSQVIQCTVFRIVTPSGEVFTLPLHELRAIHTLTPELLERLEAEEAEENGQTDSNPVPFGLAAFAALPKASAFPTAPPDHPGE